MIHKIKIQRQFADAVMSGDKCFEVRFDDRGYKKSDLVKFIAVSDRSSCVTITHPINEVVFEITYVLTGWGIKEGYCAFGIRKKGEKSNEI